MKLKDLEKYVEKKIEMAKFFGRNEEIKIKVYERFTNAEFNNFKDLYKNFNEYLNGDLTKETEVRYEDDNIIATIKYQDRNYNIETHQFEYIDKEYEITIYIYIVEKCEVGILNEYILG